MDWLVLETEEEAKAHSNAKAVEMGSGKPSDIIQYWYIWRETADGKWAVQCPEGNEEPEFEEVEE